MDIKSLGGVHFDCIYNAFSLAFKDYDVQLNKSQLIKMLKRRGFDPNLSFAYFDNGEIISFILNGIGNFNGRPTAYDTGTGTIEEYRGQGLASKLFEHSIPFLKKENIKQYLLEVIQHNTNAVSLYKNMGFNITRELFYYILKKDFFSDNKCQCEYNLINRIDFSQLKDHISFWDFQPSWQNGIESVIRDQDAFETIVVLDNGSIIGYCIYEPETGDIAQLAVKKEFRNRGIATSLLKEAVSNILINTVKIINTESNCKSINEFLYSAGAKVTGMQYEMLREL